MRKGGRQRFYARNAFLTNLGRLMQSFPARTANSEPAPGFWTAVASFVDEVYGTISRLCAYLMALALMALGGIALWEHLPTIAAIETSPKAWSKTWTNSSWANSSWSNSWSEATRTAPAFAVSQLIFPGKTESYEILRHPEGGRKDISAGAASAVRRSPNSKSIVRVKKSIRSARLRATSRPGWTRPARASWRRRGSPTASSVL